MNHHNVTQRLARFIAATRWEDLPAPVRHEGKRALLNFFGTAVSGSSERAIDLLLASLAPFSGGQAATLIGRRERTDALTASLINAASANVADFDDTHMPTVIHPTAPVAPALFALAQRKPMTGAQLLAAFAVGVEVECRIGNALSPAHYRRGWHITATCGVLGAAAAAAHALGLDEPRAGFALGNAATQACGIVESLGTMAKSLSIGNASRNGLWSAMLAQQGFTAPPQSLEGSQGFLAVMAEAADTELIERGLGERWELLNNTYKPYPCAVVINPVIEACLALRDRGDLDPGTVRQVLITGHPLLLLRADRPVIATGREAQVSAQHAAAVTLIAGEPGLSAFGDARVQDPQVEALRLRVALQEDPSLGVEAAQVVLKMDNGPDRVATIAQARGSLANPLDDADLQVKFERLVAGRLPEASIRLLIDRIWELDHVSHVAPLLGLAVPAR